MGKKFMSVKLGDFHKQLGQATARMEKALLMQLSYIGETAVKYARQKHENDWTDRTGNLRSSIGYAIYKDGDKISGSNFPVVKPRRTKPKQSKKKAKKNVKTSVSGGQKGASEGWRLLNKLSAEHPKGYVLYVVAGMEYASLVENLNGKDVLTGARLKAEELAERLLKKLEDHGKNGNGN